MIVGISDETVAYIAVMTARGFSIKDMIEGERDTLCSTAPRSVKESAKKRLSELRAEEERLKGEGSDERAPQG